jgi:flavodoxin
MKTCIIYYSYSGITRTVAEEIKKACGGDLIEVKPEEAYSTLTAYTIGSYRAMKGEKDRIRPASIDTSGYDLIVIGTPIWFGKATPVINAAVDVIRGCEGKKAVIFATCASQAKETLPEMKKDLEAKGVTVVGMSELSKKDIAGRVRVTDLIATVKSLETTP